MELVGAESVRVTLEMGVGELKVVGGADRLLEGEFTYNVPEWRPRVEYSVNGSRGDLLVKQPSETQRSSSAPSGFRNQWDLRLNGSVPMELAVKSGVGSSRLGLSGLDLSKLDVEVGVGEVVVDLAGDWKRDVDVRIKGGIGSTVVRVPRRVGVRVDAKGGLGSISASGLRKVGTAYVNDAYGKTVVTVRVSAESGIGEIRLELAE